MGTPCILYAIATIFLAWIDAMRIKAMWGLVKNIDHAISRDLAIICAGAASGWWLVAVLPLNWWSLLAEALAGIAFIGIRLTLYDPLLNLFRIWTGTNPTNRIDYVSTKTSSYEDQHSEKVGFWMKRIIGVAGLAVIFLLYKVIFRV